MRFNDIIMENSKKALVDVMKGNKVMIQDFGASPDGSTYGVWDTPNVMIFRDPKKKNQAVTATVVYIDDFDAFKQDQDKRLFSRGEPKYRMPRAADDLLDGKLLDYYKTVPGLVVVSGLDAQGVEEIISRVFPNIDTSNAVDRLQAVYNKLTRYYRSTVYSDVSFRTTFDISYSGRNRIIAILEGGNELTARYGKDADVQRAMTMWRSVFKS